MELAIVFKLNLCKSNRRGGKLLNKTMVKLLAAASLAVTVTATSALAQTSSGSGGVPTRSSSSTMGETNPGPTSDKGNAPMAKMPNQAAPSSNSAAGSGEKQRSEDH
jgi:hypothetical protein